ncbi:MAG: hypothetical protein M0T74_10425 [Desulfitobacterium hafniense]|nr:hypothetical protein [Desulfitobacterium hafniense]
MSKPTHEEWKALFEAAEAFKSAACWEWMYDDDIFGIANPETGEVAYCCIMGNAGEHFGIAGYLGAEGLDGLLGLLSGELDPEDFDNMFSHKCLMCSYENRAELAAEDLKNIKDLGLKFRGRNEWPLFRSYEPGKVPWFLSSEQCRFLTHILKEALEVSLRCQDEKEILEHATPLTFLTRVGQKHDDGRVEWVDQYLTAETFNPQYASFSIQDEIRLRKLKTIKVNQQLIIEAATFYLPSPVKENGRPYFPKVGVFIDHQSGMALSFDIVTDIETEGYKIIEKLISFIEQNQLKPAKILVELDETYYLLQDVCQQIGIILEQVEYLQFAQEFREEMFEHI